MSDLASHLLSVHVPDAAAYAFFSASAQCVAAVTGLSAAFATFHYQNLLTRIREMRDRLYDKYDPAGAGLKKDYLEQYKRCRSIEDHIDFWRGYFEKEDKGGHQHRAFEDLYSLIRQTRRFRFMVVRVAFYGFGLLMPLGIVGTLLPAAGFLGGLFHIAIILVYLGLLFFYFAMNLALARSVFISPWHTK